MSAPASAKAMTAMMHLPMKGVNIVAKTSPKGAVDWTSSALPTMPAAMLVERM